MDILENQDNYLNDFIRLNEEWIEHYFTLEEIDKALAANPKKVIDDGGYIFTLIENNNVIGVAALFNEGNHVYELARMAVSSEYRNKGYGSVLIEACLSKLGKIKAKKVHLVSNTKLKPAIALYEKYGFQTVSKGQHPIYKRADIIMQRSIS
jgi:N-acetylglutamate synthase-like GNAT family acetyltransferase